MRVRQEEKQTNFKTFKFGNFEFGNFKWQIWENSDEIQMIASELRLGGDSIQHRGFGDRKKSTKILRNFFSFFLPIPGIGN